jgi:hypothetical protein
MIARERCVIYVTGLCALASHMRDVVQALRVVASARRSDVPGAWPGQRRETKFRYAAGEDQISSPETGLRIESLVP